MTSDAHYLAFDAETGGTDTDKTLLTLYLACLDLDFNVLAELELAIKPDNGVYQLAAEAMDINKIDIVAHDKIAKTESEAAKELYNFINVHSNKGSKKLIPIGHNVSFDIDFIVSKLLAKKTWDQFVSYRKLDTATIGQFLIEAGLLPASITASLGSLAKYYGISFNAHMAKDDTLATVEVLRNMMNLVIDR